VATIFRSRLASGQNVNHWLLGKNNTDKLPLDGKKKQPPQFSTYSLPQTLHSDRAR